MMKMEKITEARKKQHHQKVNRVTHVKQRTGGVKRQEINASTRIGYQKKAKVVINWVFYCALEMVFGMFYRNYRYPQIADLQHQWNLKHVNLSCPVCSK